MLEFGSERVTSQALANSQPEMGRMSIWLGGIKYGVGETPVLTSISSRIWYSDGQSSGGDRPLKPGAKCSTDAILVAALPKRWD